MVQDKNFAREFLKLQMDKSVESRESLTAWCSTSISSDFEVIQAASTARPNHIGDKFLFVFCDQFKYGLTLPLSQEVVDVCHHYKIIPTMLTPNSFSVILGIKAMMEQAGSGWDVIAFSWFAQIRSAPNFPFVFFAPRHRTYFQTVNMPSGLTNWRRHFFMVRRNGPWEIPLFPGITPAEPLKGMKNSTVRGVLEWLTGKKCKIDLKNPFQPRLKLTERREKKEKEGDSQSGSDPEPGEAEHLSIVPLAAAAVGKRKRHEDEAGPSHTRQTGYEHVTTIPSSSSSSRESAEERSKDDEVEERTASPARSSGGGEAAPLPYIVYNSERNQATITSVPRLEPYLGDPRSRQGMEVAQAIRSDGDAEYLAGLSKFENIKIGLNHAFALQGYVYENGRRWVETAGISRRRKMRLAEARKKMENMDADMEALQSRFNKCEQDLALERRLREEDVTQRDDSLTEMRSRIHVLADDKAKMQEELDVARSETSACRQTIHALKTGVKDTIAQLDDAKSIMEGLRSSLEDTKKENEDLMSRLAEQVKEPSEQELLDRLKTTESYQMDMYDVAVDGFNVARDYMVMRNVLSAQQGEEMDYVEALTSLTATERRATP